MILVRPEEPSDIEIVRRITEEAFAASALGHNGEAPLVDTLREACPEAVSLVAEVEGAVVGHILFTTATLGGHTGMGLAPMSVSPSYWNRGVGSQLVRSGLDRLHALEVPFVVVLGHPEYYPKFGFRPAAEHGVECDFPGVPPELLFIRILDEKAEGFSGIARYHPAFYDL